MAQPPVSDPVGPVPRRAGIRFELDVPDDAFRVVELRAGRARRLHRVAWYAEEFMSS